MVPPESDGRDWSTVVGSSGEGLLEDKGIEVELFPRVGQRRGRVVATFDDEHDTRGVTTINRPTRPRDQD
jgi:hypothetical protein